MSDYLSILYSNAWWWCKNCGAGISLKEYPKTYTVKEFRNLMCNVCEEFYDKQVKK